VAQDQFWTRPEKTLNLRPLWHATEAAPAGSIHPQPLQIHEYQTADPYPEQPARSVLGFVAIVTALG